MKEKQKYYVLNQGDIIKLGKIYLKILHIKLTGSNKKDDEDEKDKANATTDKDQSDSKKIVSDSECVKERNAYYEEELPYIPGYRTFNNNKFALAHDSFSYNRKNLKKNNEK